jgi:hypothetical protein
MVSVVLDIIVYFFAAIGLGLTVLIAIGATIGVQSDRPF